MPVRDQHVYPSQLPEPQQHGVNGQPDQAVDPIPRGLDQPAGVNIPINKNPNSSTSSDHNSRPTGVEEDETSMNKDDGSTGVDNNFDSEEDVSTGVDNNSDYENSPNTIEQNIANLEQEMDTAY